MDVLEATQQGFDSFNNRTLREDLTDLLDPNVVTIDEAQGTEVQGVDAYFEYNEGFIGAMPDLELSILSHEISGNSITVKARAMGTFTGEMVTPDGTVPGNGNSLDLEYQGIWEYGDDEKLARLTTSYDLQEFMGQLGLG